MSDKEIRVQARWIHHQRPAHLTSNCSDGLDVHPEFTWDDQSLRKREVVVRISRMAVSVGSNLFRTPLDPTYR